MHSFLEKGFKINTRIIFDYELIYIESGQFEFIYHDVSYDIKGGEIILICPGVSHCFNGVNSEGVSQPHIHFDMVYDKFSERVNICFRDMPNILPSEKKYIRKNIFKTSDSPILKIENKKDFLKNFYELINAYESKQDFCQMICKAKMISLLTEIFKSKSMLFAKNESDITLAIKNYIDENFENSITLKHLEKQFNYNKYYMIRNFKSRYGISIIEYYNHLRFERAKKLLEDGYSVGKVSDSLDFSSIYVFSRFFSQRAKISPQKYKNSRLPDKLNHSD